MVDDPGYAAEEVARTAVDLMEVAGEQGDDGKHVAVGSAVEESRRRI